MRHGGRSHLARTTLSAALLGGLYVLLLLIILGALAIDGVVAEQAPALALKAFIVTSVLIVSIVRTIMSVRLRIEPPFGVPLCRSEHPTLWQEIDELGRATGTAAPDAIWLTPDANAGVMETRALRRSRNQRWMVIGMPLLATMTAGELRAVLAHEMAHYSCRHTKLAATVYRGSETIQRLMLETRRRLVTGRIIRGYAALFFRISQSCNRAQELEADQLAARVAGSAAMVSALQKLPWINASWSYFGGRFVGPGRGAGVLPEEMGGWYAELAAHPDRQTEAQQLIGELPSRKTHLYDSHPAPAERIALLVRCASIVAPDDRPATVLLTNPAELSGQFDALLAKSAGCELTPWPLFGARVGDRLARDRAGALIAALEATRPGCRATLVTAIEAVRSQPLPVADALLGPVQPMDPRLRDDARLGAARQGLQALLSCALVDAGHASWAASLVGPAFQLLDRTGQPVHVEALVDEAMTAPDGAVRLQARCSALGLSLDYRVEPDPARTAAVGDRWLATLTRLAYRLRRADLVIRTDGILMVPSRRGITRKSRTAQRLEELRGLDPASVVSRDRRARWIPANDIRDARVKGNGLGQLVHAQWTLRMRLRNRRLRFVIENERQARIADNAVRRMLAHQPT